MPWCPKCKTEYREGFTVCADCGSELVAEEPGDFFSAEKLEKESREDTWEPEWDGDVPTDEESGSAEGEESAGMESEESAYEGSGDGSRRKRTDGIGPYQDSSERASDNRSSAWMLLGLGTAGLVVVVLGAAGILPFSMGNPYLFYGVMGAIFILFFVAGIVSMKNAEFFEKKAESENSLRQTLLDWCEENLRADDIDAEVCAAGVSDEIAYFRRSSYIKEKLNHQFVNLNQGFLDQFIDDYIYDQIFGERLE